VARAVVKGIYTW